MQLAAKTIDRINACLEHDGGAEFRRHLKLAMEEVNDAFDPKEDVIPRKHLGASLIGGECARYLWLSFRWAWKEKFAGRMIRLFNRGHLEEARFIALFRQAGFQTSHLAEGGKQLRISGAWGHYGGSLDGIIHACLDAEGPGLLEFKTHNQKSFDKLKKSGVRETKFQHYVQCQQYMAHYGLRYALYVAVCKNDDELFGEIVPLDEANFAFYKERAEQIVGSSQPPPKVSKSASYSTCKFCSMRNLCHDGQQPKTTCRTCQHVRMRVDGGWHCGDNPSPMTPEQQFAACDHYRPVDLA